MKTLQMIALSFLITTLSLAQKAEFYPAYIVDGESAVTLIKENAKKHPTSNTLCFLKKYPVLASIKSFRCKDKYSLINTKLVVGMPDYKNDRIIFRLVNNKEYTVKLRKRKYFKK